MDGFSIAANAVIQNLEWYFDTSFNIVFHTASNNIIKNQAAKELFFSVITVIYTLFLLTMSWKKVRVLAHILPSMSMIILVLNIGKVPAGIFIIAYIIYAFAILAMNNAYCWNQILCRKLEVQSAIIVSSIILVLATVLMGISPPKYNYVNKRLQTLKDGINKFIDEFDLEVWSQNPVNGEDNSGLKTELKTVFKQEMSLQNIGEISYDGTIDLMVEVKNNAKYEYYLRGFVGTIYSDNKWANIIEYLDNNTEYPVLPDNLRDIMSRPAYILRLMEEADYKTDYIYNTEIAVTAVGVKHDVAFVPYNIDVDIASEYANDRVLFNIQGSRTKSYNIYNYIKYEDVLGDINVVNELIKGLSDDDIAAISKYENYVYKVYTQIPEGMEKFKKEFSNINLEANGETYALKTGEKYYKQIGLQPYIDYVKNYMQQMEYTLTPGDLTPGADFVEDFLFNKKKGYCVYFATAATMMFRQMGIPARYVEGYIVKDKDYIVNESEKAINSTTINIRDTNAHAWVEIYQDNVGWIPVEVTVGFGNASPGQTETTTSNNETTTGSNPATVITTSAAESSTMKNNNVTPEPSNGKWKWILIAVIILSSPIGIVYGFIKRRERIIRSRHKNLNIPKIKKQLIRMYKWRHIDINHYWTNDRISEAVAAGYQEELYDYVLRLYELMDKDIYAHEPFTDEEFIEFEEALHMIVSWAFSLGSPFVKLKIKYILCLL